jgi:amino acid adenylation domain-containing protein
MFFLNKVISSFNNYPDRNAFCIEDKFYTYDDLAKNVSLIQNKLNHFHSEDKIGIIVGNNIETYAAIIAILLSGRTYIPIHPGHPPERIQQIIQQSGLKVILTKSSEYSFIGIQVLEYAIMQDANKEITFAIPNIDIVHTHAYILFTSGSTGIPKGVSITYYNLDSFVSAFFANGYQIDEYDRFVQMFDLTFDLSVMSYLLPLCIGACVYTVSENGMKFTNVFAILEKYHITFALLVPSLLSHLRPYFDEISLPHLKYNLFCGEALYNDVLTEWMNCAPGAIFENVYGPTEATIFCLIYRIHDKTSVSVYNEIVCIGKPMKNMEALIVSEHAEIQDDNDNGELCLSGSQLTPGYLNEEQNKTTFFTLNGKKYYRTGDIAYKEKNGNFMFCGRVDQQVKIQGYRIELSEIEFHLRKLTKSGVVAIVVKGNNGLNQIDVVFEDKTTSVENVLSELKTKLPAYMIPVNVHFITPFPLNVNGKTDRKAISKMITTSI